jgi:hypothetical protein
VIKYFRFDWDFVLWGISFSNLNMLLATIPTYEKEDKKEEVIEHEGIDGIANYFDFN